jgi:hypothetical protein
MLQDAHDDAGVLRFCFDLGFIKRILFSSYKLQYVSKYDGKKLKKSAFSSLFRRIILSLGASHQEVPHVTYTLNLCPSFLYR